MLQPPLAPLGGDDGSAFGDGGPTTVCRHGDNMIKIEWITQGRLINVHTVQSQSDDSGISLYSQELSSCESACVPLGTLINVHTVQSQSDAYS